MEVVTNEISIALYGQSAWTVAVFPDSVPENNW